MLTLRCLATSSASSGCARPLRNIRFFFGVPDFAAMSLTPCRCDPWCSLAIILAFIVPRGLVQRAPGGLGGGGALPVLEHPLLEVSLRPTGDGQRAGRDVAPDHRAGPGVGAVPDGDGSDEHVVRAGLRVRAD